jgi:hypothetical protein
MAPGYSSFTGTANNLFGNRLGVLSWTVQIYPREAAEPSWPPATPPKRGFPPRPRMRPKADSNRSPPALLEHAAAEPFPLPPPAARGTREWRARRLASSRRRLPHRGRPGRKPGFPTPGP